MATTPPGTPASDTTVEGETETELHSSLERARLLHPAANHSGPLDTSVLDDIAAGLASVAAGGETRDPWEVHTTLLLATEAYDAYLMEWGPASMSDTHDHGGSVGVVHVVSGSLLEATQSIDADVPSPPRRLEAGDSTQLSAAVFHRLFNQTSATTVTVNVYSPPIRHD